MVKASKGIMEKTRQKFRRGPRQRGLSPITRSFQSFEVGERVTIVIDSSLQNRWPHDRFNAMKIVDLLPTHLDDVRAIFAKERFALSKEDADKVLEIVGKYR